ncbi:MAG: hypothetical protein XU13_C0010G0034 [Candidatus Rokubacteria bacterium CSP1-6]|nr:MAG: hypothetical protein XU13_C0010G0034 [Candidatus Rokubacteria bacterium CSP1-6]
MLKALVIAIAALTLLAGPAMAGQCPLLIKQLNEAAGKMKAGDAMVAKAKPVIAEAQKLHDGGKHADAVKKCEEAAKILGVKLEMKK